MSPTTKQSFSDKIQNKTMSNPLSIYKLIGHFFVIFSEGKESVTEILNNNGTSQEDTITFNVKATVDRDEDDPVINSIDWKPEDKCNFCIDGKLLTVNAKGDLVPESDPAIAAADLAKRVSSCFVCFLGS